MHLRSHQHSGHKQPVHSKCWLPTHKKSSNQWENKRAKNKFALTFACCHTNNTWTQDKSSAWVCVSRTSVISRCSVSQVGARLKWRRHKRKGIRSDECFLFKQRQRSIMICAQSFGRQCCHYHTFDWLLFFQLLAVCVCVCRRPPNFWSSSTHSWVQKAQMVAFQGTKGAALCVCVEQKKSLASVNQSIAPFFSSFCCCCWCCTNNTTNDSHAAHSRLWSHASAAAAATTRSPSWKIQPTFAHTHTQRLSWAKMKQADR